MSFRLAPRIGISRSSAQDKKTCRQYTATWKTPKQSNGRGLWIQ